MKDTFSRDPLPPGEERLVAQGLSLLTAGRASDLLDLIAQACPEGPKDPRIQVQKAYAHARLGQVANALGSAQLAMGAPLSELWALDLLGTIFTLCHKPDEAYAAYARAHTVAPDRPDVLFNLATAAGFRGYVDQAEQAYDRIIATAPDNAEAWHNRSLLRRQTPEDNHVAQLYAVLGRHPPWQQEVYLRFALGKELEDLADHDLAFANIAQGATLRRRHMRYAVSEDIEAMQRIASAHDERWCAPAKASTADSGPIFIIGMPRSGSTLLERMLGRHSQVQSLGELPYFGQALIARFRDRMARPPANKSELIDVSTDLASSAIGNHYMAAVDPLRDARPRFIDKLPMNFLYGGLIAKSLPDATLVHVRRQPLDLCFAIYKTLFRDAYPFSYDFAELGAYHQAYRALLDHWRQALGGSLVEIDYEDLVISPRETIVSLLHRLGLSFEEDCLSPEKDGSAVMTASAAQVRKPIHASSVGSAGHYARHLEPLKAVLGK